jgi:hypothetical protein
MFILPNFFVSTNESYALICTLHARDVRALKSSEAPNETDAAAIIGSLPLSRGIHPRWFFLSGETGVGVFVVGRLFRGEGFAAGD